MSQRTRILIDPKVQWPIAGRLLCHWALFLVCLLSINTAVRLFATVVNEPFWEAFQSALVAQAPIVIVMFILLPVFLRDTLVMSNRFAGPMYRIRSTLSQLSSGKSVSSISFREGDFWLEVAKEFNVVLDQYESLKRENERLRVELKKSDESLSV